MPIRTRRGRSAAYRALWEWPLRSPARLILCLVVLVVVVGAISTLSSHLAPARHGNGALSPVPRSSAPARPAAPSPVPELTPANLPLTAAPPAALTVATRWTQAWANHPPGTTATTWSAGLAPFTTPEYLGVLTSVDPGNVPGRRVTGPAQAVAVRPDSVRVQVPTDAARLELLLVQVGPGDWRVSGYDRAS